jgi:hypothetical protein
MSNNKQSMKLYTEEQVRKALKTYSDLSKVVTEDDALKDLTPIELPSDKNIIHLQWIYDRMSNVHDEDENYDYMLKFKEIIEQLKSIENNDQHKQNKMKDLDMNMFAFLSWLMRNRHAETESKLKIIDGYEWYNEQWKCWLKNSDAGKQIQLNQSGEVTWWGGNPGMNNNTVTDENNTTGETTIEFPKQHKPEPNNPNKPSLDTMVFKFEQEENCVDGGDGETLIVEAKSSLGIDGDGGAFYVMRTEQWAFNDIDELITMLKRVEAALDAVKPTSIHVK